jgi:hypothetical protein
MERVPEIDLTSREAFILLLAILYHDIGKTVTKAKQRDQLRHKKVKELTAYQSINKDHHALYSAALVQIKQESWGIGDEGIAECVWFLCLAHFKDFAPKMRELGILKDRFLDQFGRIRLGWLGALLAIGDDLDNSYHRVAPDWAIGKTKKAKSKAQMRDGFDGCEVDLQGRLLVVH